MSAPEKAIVILKATLDMVRVLGAPLFERSAANAQISSG